MCFINCAIPLLYYIALSVYCTIPGSFKLFFFACRNLTPVRCSTHRRRTISRQCTVVVAPAHGASARTLRAPYPRRTRPGARALRAPYPWRTRRTRRRYSTSTPGAPNLRAGGTWLLPPAHQNLRAVANFLPPAWASPAHARAPAVAIFEAPAVGFSLVVLHFPYL